MSSARPRVVYVMGAGRSGSTILGVALGNCPGFVYAGELDAWLRRRGVPNFGGEEGERFWAGVMARMRVEEEMFGDVSRARLEHSSAVLRPGRWAARRRLGPTYRRIALDLYAEIVAATGAEYVIDSSHYPMRAAELQRIGGLDLRLVYLYRSPHAVVASFARQDVKQPAKPRLATNMYLLLTHALSMRVFNRQPREKRLLLQYEAFAADPAGTLRRLLEFVGAPAELPDLAALRTGVAFQGNRLLESEQVAMRSSEGRANGGDPLTAGLQAPVALALDRLDPAIRLPVEGR